MVEDISVGIVPLGRGAADEVALVHADGDGNSPFKVKLDAFSEANVEPAVSSKDGNLRSIGEGLFTAVNHVFLFVGE